MQRTQAHTPPKFHRKRAASGTTTLIHLLILRGKFNRKLSQSQLPLLCLSLMTAQLRRLKLTTSI